MAFGGGLEMPLLMLVFCMFTMVFHQIVDAVLSLDEGLDISMVGVKKVPGGSVTDSFLVKGVAFKKTFSYAGFEQQPKTFVNPKILLLNVELELKSEKENAEVRLDDPTKYQSIVDAEWNIIYEKLELCVKSGAQIILSKLPVGDLATQYFADRGLFCAGRVAQDDMERTQRATGGVVQTSVHDMNASVLGSCGRFEERQVGNERYNIFMQCAEAKSSTIVLRGGAEQFIEEAHRSVHDALMVVKRAVASSTVVAGGGAIEMEVSRYLRQYARTIEGKAQLLVNAYAKAFEIIPRQIADNAGHDATDILNARSTSRTPRRASGSASISPRVASVTHTSRTCGNLRPTRSTRSRRPPRPRASSCPWTRRCATPSRSSPRQALAVAARL